MRLNSTYQAFLSHLEGTNHGELYKGLIQEIVYDSRKINPRSGLVFFALKGSFRDGHAFISDAYSKGIRIFVVERIPNEHWKDAHFILVENVLLSLQKLAIAYRKKLQYPIVAITGSLGKTTVKEWMYHLLFGQLHVFRSPKSYNSQLGVALSVLQLPETADLALIEVAISKPEEMYVLREMVNPTFGILTNVLETHSIEFNSLEAYRIELCSLFTSCEWVIVTENEGALFPLLNGLPLTNLTTELQGNIPFQDVNSTEHARLSIAAAMKFTEVAVHRVQSLPQLAMRLETFQGIHESLIINDTYTMDLEAFKSSLAYQLSIANGRRRIALIGLSAEQQHLKDELLELCHQFGINDLHFYEQDVDQLLDLKHAIVLVKGPRFMQHVANRLKEKQHKTQLNYDLSALKNNLNQYKSLLQPTTKMLAMVKAQSYGAGLTTLATYLEKQGIDYFGVAYSDEGVELRKAGIVAPILVMNAEEEGMESCVIYQLEPAIYDFDQLDELLKVLIIQEKTGFPIHIKIDTGMKRLGFHPSEVPQLIEILAAQPEVSVASVYSHLAHVDQGASDFTLKQIALFEKACAELSLALSYPFMRHILNSEGIAHYVQAQFEMVRMGIGLFGLSTNEDFSLRLKPVLNWTSSISQVKKICQGESVGYGQTFVAQQDMRIGIIPIGYADGFRRSLSNGAGAVYIQGVKCPVVGRVCMDMIMVDIGALIVDAKTKVEIIGKYQSLSALAKNCNTIPYEILTSISPRVHRSYSEEE